MTDIAAFKKETRRKLREITRSLTPEYKTESAESIVRQCIESEEYKNAHSIFVFISMDGEPDTTKLIEQAFADGKEVYVPRCLSEGIMEAIRIDSFDKLKPGRYGILEPDESIKATEVEVFDGEDALAIVPCVGATADGKRMGHGAGYYDRFLEGRKMKTVMIVYKRQMLEAIPCDEHDIIMDKVISEQN